MQFAGNIFFIGLSRTVSAQCVCLVRADVFPSVRVSEEHQRRRWREVGRNRGMGERKSKGLLRGREDRGCDERGRGKTGRGGRLICMLVTVCCLFDLEGVLSAGWWDAAEWGRQK